MKKLMLVLMATCLFTAISAQSMVPTTTDVAAQTMMGEKTPIEPSELPEAVQQVLESEAYDGWEVSEAYMLEAAEESELPRYEIHLMQDNTTFVVIIDEEGQVIPQKEEE